MTQLDPKYVASTRPINRRTAAKQSLQQQPVNPVVHERLAAIKARSRLGAPLAEQLHFPASPNRPKALSAWLVVGSILSAISAMALLLAWIQFSWPLAVAGAFGLPAGLAMILGGHRAAGATLQTATLFDEASLHAFDRILDELAPDAPEELAVQLTEIKQQLTRIARLAGTSSVDENFTMEDRMYLTESVRRYLPDSLQGYLMVPKDQRSTQISGQGQTATSMLLGQLNLLRAELAKQEVKLTKNTAESLVRQQRFLESKTKL